MDLFRGVGRFNLGLALIGFRTTGARFLSFFVQAKKGFIL